MSKLFTRTIKSTFLAVTEYDKATKSLKETTVILEGHFKTSKEAMIAAVESYENKVIVDCDFEHRIEQNRKYGMTLEDFLKYAKPIEGDSDESEDE